jgi:hypothetical protein
MVAWLTALTTLAGPSAFSARLGAVVCSALLGWLVFRFAARLFTPRAGFIALVAVTIPPVFFFTSFLVNPEGPLAPLWVLILWLLDDLRRKGEPWRPLVLGLVIGVGFLTKYTAILAVPLALLFVATSSVTRTWLRRPSFYAGGLVALAVASPVVLWNFVHHWPSVRLHLVERMVTPGQVSPSVHALRMVGDQFLFMQPLLLPGLLAMLAVAMVRARADDRYRLLAIAGGPVLLFFYAVMVRAPDAEPHWAMVGYLPLTIAAGGWVDERIDHASRALKVYLGACVAVSATFVAVYFTHTQTPTVMRLVPPSAYDATLDPVNETLGWDRVRAAIQDEVSRLGPGVVVAGSHNVLCGQLAARIDDQPHVYCSSPRRTAFDFFGRREPPAAAHVIYVDSARYHEDVSQRLPQRSCARTQVLDMTRDGRAIGKYSIYVCGPKVDAARPGFGASAS